MRSLLATLKEYELDMLQIIANRWDVDLNTRDEQEAAGKLARAMLNRERAEYEWTRLSDGERGALQMVLGANRAHKIAEKQFARLFGEIRQMGTAKREREKPHLSPAGLGEVLYYRGLLSIAFDQTKTGAQSFVYVPEDLAELLPINQTGYDLNAPLLETPATPTPTDVFSGEEPPVVRKAATTLVDDIATYLAYLRIYSVTAEKNFLPEATEKALSPYLLGTGGVARLDLIHDLAQEIGLVSEEEGVWRVKPEARHWLEKSRTEQVEALIKAWHTTSKFNELLYVPDIEIEETGWRNDPTLLRETLRSVLAILPSDEDWLSIEELVEEIKATDPDFQRPGGDYESWYIRDRQTGDYLLGFESWSRIEGEMLRFALSAPMFWLGLVDLGGQGTSDDLIPPLMCRLTAFGKAWVNADDGAKFPHRPDTESKLTLEADGKVSVPRIISRYDRFQLARFTDWESTGDPFIYRFTPRSIKRAGEQGIKLEHIQAFIQRTTDAVFPPALLEKMQQWQKAAGVTFQLQRMLVLRVESEEQLNTLWETPDLRRFLGTRLGPRAVGVRAEQWEGLVTALEAQGITIDRDL